MESINNIKPGNAFIYKNQLYKLILSHHNKTGRGQAFVKAKIKNLRSGSITIVNFSSKEKIERAHILTINAQYLYYNGLSYVFINNENFEQIELKEEKILDEKKFLRESLEVQLMTFENEIVDLKLPEKVTYKISYTEDAVKGNTVSGGRQTKKATLENNLIIDVPIFIKKNSKIIVSTQTGKYVSKG